MKHFIQNFYKCVNFFFFLVNNNTDRFWIKT